jgi:hypothetical protein
MLSLNKHQPHKMSKRELITTELSVTVIEVSKKREYDWNNNFRVPRRFINSLSNASVMPIPFSKLMMLITTDPRLDVQEITGTSVHQYCHIKSTIQRRDYDDTVTKLDCDSHESYNS